MMGTGARVKTRKERDALGELRVPASAYYGIQTMRAAGNFPVSGLRQAAEMIEAVVRIKKAEAETNAELGLLERRRAAAIARAADEVLEGGFRGQFVVDVFEMGAGTAFHMNVNEVLANRAGELLGARKGKYRRVHPNDHVNMGQSTNDVFPTAMRLATLQVLRERLLPALSAFARSLARKGRAFGGVVKSGRTHLQDAVPIRLGQEFAAYAAAVARSREALARAAEPLLELGLGGSAVGTGLNVDPRAAALVTRKLAAATRFKLRRAADPREAMQSLGPFAGVSAALRNAALEIIRIANDLRLLASGPRTGLAEIRLPAAAPGSSIMPGKVNPSMLEMLDMAAFEVCGRDATVALAVQAGQLELNVMMPVVAHDVLFSARLLANALDQARTLCVDGIEADAERCRAYAEASPGLATALSPVIGYAAAAAVAREAAHEEKSVLEVVRAKRFLSGPEIERALDPAGLTEPGLPARAVRLRNRRPGRKPGRKQKPASARTGGGA